MTSHGDSKSMIYLSTFTSTSLDCYAYFLPVESKLPGANILISPASNTIHVDGKFSSKFPFNQLESQQHSTDIGAFVIYNIFDTIESVIRCDIGI